ncbi:putative Endonuclease III [Klebsormidium nitens]|uniref:Endonuclease III homolog n=1 Tax=Klebsormidium nitens TaxID=105231 RepID=A0A1Y1HQ98_KLENI|nr:putative Endonuclease III [Klebsormidium nitens]|eukprot:GAQ78737.1 putative Endonuclease III [Klebsormidium nitens]
MEALERFRFITSATAGSRRVKKNPPPAARKKSRVGLLDGDEADIEELAVLASNAGNSGVSIISDGGFGAMPPLQGANTSAECTGEVLGATGVDDSPERKFGAKSNQRGRKAGRGAFKWGTATAQAPERWKEVLDGIREMRTARDAPVDLFGTRQCVDPEADLETQRFQALVAAMISSQTKDPVTAAAMLRLRALPGGLTIANVASPEMSVESLQGTLHPVGFFRQKGAHLKAMAQKLAAAPHNGRVPSTVNELMELPGVGPKVAHLTLVVAFDMPEEGLIVDTHVRRVCERLGWASPDRTPEQTRLAIESWLPKAQWAETSLLLVGFGQQVCTPLRPRCGDCRISALCPSAFRDLATKTERKQGKSRAAVKRKKGETSEATANDIRP